MSGDAHIHMNYGGHYRNTPENLARQAEAEDLRVVHNLIVNKEVRIPDVEYFRGDALDPAALCCCAQVHETRIARVGATGPRGRLEGCDAVLTDVPGVPLMTFSADCPLIVLYDPRRRVLGLVHASWRCTVARLTEQVVRALTAEYGVRPADLRVGIGPGAGPCCYEVQQDVYDAARELRARDAAFQRRDGRLYFDLGRANLAQLAAAGVPPPQVELAGLCTLCHNDLLYSFRREKAGCGHFGLMAALRPEGSAAPVEPPAR
mgnify:CR=1 FL=1